MELLRIRAILFLDIGGYLFPDHPNENTPPNPDVIELTRKHCILWGSDDCFIAANVSERYDRRDENHLVKDLQLLNKFEVHKKTGLVDDFHHFYKCYGPASKGPEIDRRASILKTNGWNVLQVICDNSYTVARNAFPETHCIILNGKEKNSFQNQLWRSTSPTNLHEVTSADEIAILTAHLHLQFIKNIANLILLVENSIHSELQGLYCDEYKRTRAILELNDKQISENLRRL
jgi:hypothetical protein